MAGQRLEPRAVAGSADHDVRRAGSTVGEAGIGTVEPFNAGLHDDPAGFHRADEAVVDGDSDALGRLPAEGAKLRARVATPAQVPEGDPLQRAQVGVLDAQRQVPGGEADRVHRDAAIPQRRDVHARARRQPQHRRVAAGQVIHQVDARVTRAHHEHVAARHIGDIPELPGMEERAGKSGCPGPAGHDRLSIWPDGDHHVRGGDARAAQVKLPPRIGPVDAAHDRAEPDAQAGRVLLQIGDVVIAGGERPVAAGDAHAGLMREHPVRVQLKMIVPRSPCRGHRVGLLDDQRIYTGTAYRPGCRQPCGPRADHRHALVHGASLQPGGTAVKAGGRSGCEDERSSIAFLSRRWPFRFACIAGSMSSGFRWEGSMRIGAAVTSLLLRVCSVPLASATGMSGTYRTGGYEGDRMPEKGERFRQRRWTSTGTIIASAVTLISALGLVGGAAPGVALATGPAASRPQAPASSCHLAHGIKHVVQLGFDNVHFFRDNPNVPSDLQMMPNLLNFFEGNGTFLSNDHTPLIAHTGDDLLTTATGLYGDRQGMPVSNGYRAYNTDGTTDPAGSFAYWTDPIFDTAAHPNPGHDTNPSMVYSPAPPATTSAPPVPDTVTPAPWVPFTRAGCDVGEVATANQELENTAVDIPKVFGTNSPEAQQLAADPDSFKDAETADYVGIGVHCGRGNAICASAQAVKFGQTTATASAVPDVLPDEPGGYAGFQALFGHRYVAPQLGAGTPSLTHHGFPVTNAAGNLVDENGNELDGAFLTAHPGFPGFGEINASQTLAYMADMLESGVPVVNGYLSDIHGNEDIPGLSACAKAPAALGSGSACYVAQAQYYNTAFGTFFRRLAADGITPHNTLFVLSSDEGDHEAGANVGRAIQPTPANCDGATVSGTTVTPDVPCTYPAGSFGELDGNITGLLATQEHDTTPFSLESDTAPEFYVTGQPGPDAPQVRTLEHDVAGLTAANPYTGTTQPIANYLADPAAEAIVHMVNADPARTPTLAMFARPDYFLTSGSATCSGSCVQQNTGFAWDHGDYAAEIDTNYIGMVGPGVRQLGLDGSPPGAGPSSAGPDSGQITVPDENTTGPWTDETDIRPTLMYLTGLRDDYEHDGRVITQILGHRNSALSAPGVTRLGECYKQLNSSVGKLGTDTLIAATRAIESTSPGDATYLRVDHELRNLEVARDWLASRIKGELEAAAFQDARVRDVVPQILGCQQIIRRAHRLARSS
jgi:hypothetical protein